MWLLMMLEEYEEEEEIEKGVHLVKRKRVSASDRQEKERKKERKKRRRKRLFAFGKWQQVRCKFLRLCCE